MEIDQKIGNEFRHLNPTSRWNGTYKDLTKDCEGCDFYKIVDKEPRCYQGIAWKYLVKGKKLRKCQYVK